MDTNDDDDDDDYDNVVQIKTNPEIYLENALSYFKDVSRLL